MTLPDYARPLRIRIVDSIPLTAGFRPLKRTLDDAEFADGVRTFVWGQACNDTLRQPSGGLCEMPRNA
jgi:acyl-CoA synthetase (AMP-forming)/AMP-acid ligase II